MSAARHGDGTFDDAVEVSFAPYDDDFYDGHTPSSSDFLVEDLSGDGRVDLAYRVDDGGRLGIRTGRADGSFDPPKFYRPQPDWGLVGTVAGKLLIGTPSTPLALAQCS